MERLCKEVDDMVRGPFDLTDAKTPSFARLGLDELSASGELDYDSLFASCSGDLWYYYDRDGPCITRGPSTYLAVNALWRGSLRTAALFLALARHWMKRHLRDEPPNQHHIPFRVAGETGSYSLRHGVVPGCNLSAPRTGDARPLDNCQLHHSSLLWGAYRRAAL